MLIIPTHIHLGCERRKIALHHMGFPCVVMRLIIVYAFLAIVSIEDSDVVCAQTIRLTEETDKQALLEFKSQLSETSRAELDSWNDSLPLCRWTGVKCGSKHRRVTGVDLGGLKLTGVVSPFVGNLSFLKSLNLADNVFRGAIPLEVGNLSRLQYLNMSKNLLGGAIPVVLSNCSNLSILDLSSNLLEQGVPAEIGLLKKLISLNLRQNNLEGKLPATLGNSTSLRSFDIEFNNIEGGIPDDIARLTQLVYITLAMNNFSGVFPPAFYNMSSLEFLGVLGNRFSGSLRSDFGDLLPNLQGLSMGRNHFTGAIPITLPNISTLQMFGISRNSLSGSIPPSFGKIQNLQYLSLLGNSLGSYSSGDLEFLGSLTNCTQLETLYVGENRLGGRLPISIANLSANLKNLDLGTNFISGSIPYEIENLISLQRLGLGGNRLSGLLPISIGKLIKLEGLILSSNSMSGEIPSSIGNITRLVSLYLANNSFEGIVPSSLGDCSNLRDLLIGFNRLSGTIPREVLQIRTLVTLSMSHNALTGSLPNDVGGLENLITLSLSDNKLSEKLPQALGNCLSLERLYLHGNSFHGDIPDLRGLVGAKRIDLSNNNLSGSIPGYFSNFSSLEYLNLSVNNFEGGVPTEGIFDNATIISVFGNKDLCGGIRELQLKPCSVQEPPMQAKNSALLKKVAIGVSVAIAFLLFIALVSLRWFRKGKTNQQTNNSIPSTLEVFHEKISYGDLRNATEGFSSSNMIGSGSFGVVFKAFLPAENNVVAVKVLNMQRRGAKKSFMAECESLKDIRHRNLVKLLTACSSTDFQGNEFRALIYEFLPNGNLDMWLHPEEVEEIRKPSRTLTLLERLNIAIDVASVFDYLHVYCHDPIVHCDLKPSNVLLDDDMIAHVCDFGLARLLLKFDQEFFLNQLSSAGINGTIGYAAPEYGMGGQPSIQGDAYSFGVLLLEMFTGKRPTNELFGGNFTLHSYTKSALPERVLDIVDKSILHSDLGVGFPVAECLTLIFKVGLRCCEESPRNRLAMNVAAKELNSISERFFKVRRTARG